MNSWHKIVGHDWAVTLLQNSLRSGRVGQAYLITGTNQIGKTTLARVLAQAVNCVGEGEKPCGKCRQCQLISKTTHPDLHIISPEISGRGKETIKINSIRELQRDLQLAPIEATRRVVILRRFDTATIGAANAFLKTLEEPPRQVMLILTALDAESMLPTISSRCRTLPLRPLSQPLIESSLRLRWDVESQQSHLLSHLADGRLGWAVDRVENPGLLENREALLAQFYDVVDGDVVARFQTVDKLARKPEVLPALLQMWLTWWRDLVMLSWENAGTSPPATTLTNIDQLPLLQKYAGKWSQPHIFASLKQTKLALWQLERNANTRLVLENLFLTYPE